MPGGRLWEPWEMAMLRAVPRFSRDGSYRRIAKATGRTVAAVAVRHQKLHHADGPAFPRRPWSDAELAALHALRAQGFGWVAIAAALKRTPRSVQSCWENRQRGKCAA